MNFNVPVAGWILSVVTFLAGTLVPVLWNRLSYEGIAIKQPYEFRALTKQAPESKEVIFTTLIKIANAKSDPALIDDITLGTNDIDGVQFSLTKISFMDAAPGVTIYIPFDTQEKMPVNYLPFIVTGNEERQIAIEFRLAFSAPKDVDAFETISKRLEGSGAVGRDQD